MFDTHRISSQSLLSFHPRLPRNSWDTLRTTVQPVNISKGQRSATTSIIPLL